MSRAYSFRFVDDKLNRRFLALIQEAGISHEVDKDGVVHYSANDVLVVENELVGSIRDEAFASWQTLHCPKDWVKRYRAHMTRRGAPFFEELSDGKLSFLLPRKHRPFAWKMDGQ